MDELARLKAGDRIAVFRTAADEQSLPPLHVEKDFWVCWLVRRLFEPLLLPGMVFKGGTSLSKVWQAISRFSEDIDITIPRSQIPGGIEAEVDPRQSRNQSAKRRRNLHAAVDDWCAGEALTELRGRISSSLGGTKGWSLSAASDTLEFAYPPGVSDGSTVGRYVTPSVRVEFGAAMPTEPAEDHKIRPYCSTAGMYRMVSPDTGVRVLSPERTFWEKATLLHAENSREVATVRDRISRHYADMAALADHDIGTRAMERKEILADVAFQKQLYYPAGHVDYDAAASGAIMLVPPDDHLPALRQDYEKMREMYFEDPIPFDAVMERLKRLQAEVRR